MSLQSNSELLLQSVSVQYEKHCALDDINLRIEPGQFVVIIGPSGCGKTTLLLAMAGLLPIARGAIYLGGRSISRPNPSRLVVFQDFDQLLPWRTVDGNIAFGLAAGRARRGEPRLTKMQRKEVTAELMHLVRLETAAGRYPCQLSGGMKQRAAIARALAANPDVLLMDEPFAALDEQTREFLQLELIRIWQESRKTIVFVTHNIREAAILGGRVVVLGANPGHIVDVLNNPIVPRYPGDRDRDIQAKFEEDLRSLITSVPQAGLLAEP